MFIIQNLACLPLTITPEDKRSFIQRDMLKGKRINRILVYSGNRLQHAYSPIDGKQLSYLDTLDDLSLFVTLNDGKENFVEDFNLKNSLVTDFYKNFCELNFNRKINLEHSFFSYKTSDTVVDTYRALAYIFYQTEKNKDFDFEVNGSMTYRFKTTQAFETIKLADFVDESLRGKRIKRIVPKSETTGYLDINCYDGKRIEHLPVSFLDGKDNKFFAFDKLNIDFENSTYKNSYIADNDIHLTFIY